jgi:hypothetical protein
MIPAETILGMGVWSIKKSRGGSKSMYDIFDTL